MTLENWVQLYGIASRASLCSAIVPGKQRSSPGTSHLSHLPANGLRKQQGMAKAPRLGSWLQSSPAPVVLIILGVNTWVGDFSPLTLVSKIKINKS